MCQVNSSTMAFWTGPFLIEGLVISILLFMSCLIEIPVLNSNCVDTDLGLYCLPTFLLWDADIYGLMD